MTVQEWSDNIVLVELPNEPKTAEEIEKAIGYLREHTGYDVVMDFSDVTILTSSSLASLLRLKKLLQDGRKRLLLCSVSAATRGIISVTGLEELLDICEDRFSALATVQAMPESCTSTN